MSAKVGAALLPGGFEFLRGSARRRATFAYVAWRVIGAWFLALPLGSVLSTSAREFPRGDAELFDAGGVFLLEVLRLNSEALRALVNSALLQLFVVGALGLIPLSCLFVTLTRTGGAWVVRAARALPGLALLGLVYWAGIALLGLAAWLLLGFASSLLAESTNELLTDVLLAGLALPFAGLALLLHPWLDLGRAALVANPKLGVRGSAGLALERLLRTPSTLLPWLLPSALGWLVFGACVALAVRIPGHDPGSFHVGLSMALHQLGFLALTLGRLVWLSCAAWTARFKYTTGASLR